MMSHMASILILFTLLCLGAAQVEPDRTVLQQLYIATGGSSWINQWNTSASTLCSSTYISTIECWANGKVRRLKLASNNLVGTLPTEIGLLSSLDTLILSKNSLSGTLPTQIAQLTNLGSFSANANQLSGTIPTELGLLPKLAQILLDSNQFSGAIPTQVVNHPSATVLRLTLNQLSGSLPSVWSPNFTDILLDFNQITGTIPPGIFNSKLSRLRLQGNQLTGTIPTEIGSATSLTEFYVFQNSLSGSMPTQLAGALNLQRIWMYNNNLTGSIPQEFGNSPNLLDLRIQSNTLSGSIPTQLGLSKTLQSFWVSDNNLSGEIPTQLGSASSLLTLRFAGNQFEGNVPGPLLRLPNLTLLQLSKTCLGPVEPYSTISTNDYSTFEVGPSCGQGGPYPQNALAMSPLVAYQFTPNLLVDSSANANNLVVNDAGAIYQSLPLGQFKNPRNTAVQVQVTSNFAFRATSRLNLTSSYSVELLFINTNIASANDLFAFSTGSAGTSQVLRLKVNPNGSFSLFRSTSTLVFQTAPAVLNPTRANHVALTFSSPTRVMTLYVNGIQQQQATLDASMVVTGNFFFFLSRNSALALDEAAVYGSSLSAATVAARIASLNWCPPSACLGTCTPTLTGSSCS